MNPYAPPTLAALTGRLDAAGIPCLDDGERFGAAPGEALLLLLEDPARLPESWDLAVILPEALKSAGAGLRVAAVAPAAAKPLAARYGIRVWPALLLLRDGGYVGALEGLRDWAGYCREIPSLRALPVTRAPGIGVPVQAASDGCHQELVP